MICKRSKEHSSVVDKKIVKLKFNSLKSVRKSLFKWYQLSFRTVF